MIISRKFETEDTIFWFRKETDDDGSLVCQSERLHNKFYNIDSDEGYYQIRMAELGDINFNKPLCHVTSRDRLDDIIRYGIVPQVGEIYKGYWLKGRECNELLNMLEPGIFLMQGGKTFKAHFRKPVRLYIDANSLHLSSLYVDQAFPKGESLFYAKVIPPESILIRRIQGGRTMLTPLIQEHKEGYCPS
jgi:hypothetical protein